jgi:hypothetical protein
MRKAELAEDWDLLTSFFHSVPPEHRSKLIARREYEAKLKPKAATSFWRREAVWVRNRRKQDRFAA